MNNTPEHPLVYVGTYTRKDSEGIYVYRFDPESGALKLVSTTPAENPSFLAIHPGKRRLYAANEVGQYQGEPTGAVSAFAVDGETGALTLINQRPSHGTAPCHLSVDALGNFVYAANYSSGTATVYPVQLDGGLSQASDVVQHAGSGPNPRRQQGPHAHSINLSPDGRFAFVADLGIDRVMIYDVAALPGKLTPNAAAPYAQVAPGAGPRHLAFHPGGRFAYLINEMGNTLTALAYDAETGALTEIESVPTLPEDFDGRNTTADVHVAPSGTVVYGSNRGHDSIVAYAVDAATGKLCYIEHTPSGGKTPRNFALDPTGRFLLAANQDSDNLVVFRIDAATGKLSPTGHEAQVSMPVCVKFLT